MGIFGKPEYVYKTEVTSDDTQTTVHQESLAALQVMAVTVKAVVKKSDGTVVGQFLIAAAFRREASGNVVISGNQHNIVKDVTGSAALSIAIEANTTTQTVDVKVTGIAASSYTWEVGVSTQRI